MNYSDYVNSIKDVPFPAHMKFRIAVLWLHPWRMPLALTSVEDENLSVIKVPANAVNECHGHSSVVPVIAFGRRVFSGRECLTDLVLPSTVSSIPEGAFAGCKNLRNITIPRAVVRIEKGTFEGCDSLENIYYEGTKEEWDKVQIVHRKHEIEFGEQIGGSPVLEVKAERYIHIPGNEPLFSANIHFGCALEKSATFTSFYVKMGKEDITPLFNNSVE